MYAGGPSIGNGKKQKTRKKQNIFLKYVFSLDAGYDSDPLCTDAMPYHFRMNHDQKRSKCLSKGVCGRLDKEQIKSF